MALMKMIRIIAMIMIQNIFSKTRHACNMIRKCRSLEKHKIVMELCNKISQSSMGRIISKKSYF